MKTKVRQRSALTRIGRHSWQGWMAVQPLSEQPWPEPWVYLTKRCPKEIAYSGYKPIRVIITRQPMP